MTGTGFCVRFLPPLTGAKICLLCMLDGIEKGEVRKHEVVEPLARLIQNGTVSRSTLEGMIDAREFDLFDTAPASLNALDDYIDQTSGRLSLTAARVLGGADNENGDDALETARRAGNAYGTVGILRAMVFHGRAKRQYVPAELMEQFGVRTGDIFEFRCSDPVRQMTKYLAAYAGEKIRDARKMRAALPKSALSAALPVVLAENYLIWPDRPVFVLQFGHFPVIGKAVSLQRAKRL